MPKKGTSVAAKKAATVKAKVAETKARSDANPRPKRNGEVAKDVARSHAAWPTYELGSLDWSDPEFGRTVAEMNASGMTVKELTAELGLPAEQPVWRKVSLAMRAYKDAHGMARPGRRSATPVAAPTGNGKEKATTNRPSRTEHAPKRVTLDALPDEEVTAAIEGRWLTYNFASAPGNDEVFCARVKKYETVPARGGRGERRVVTFLDHVSPPSAKDIKAEMELARKEKREPRELPERADGVVRSVYVDQIVSIGKRG